MNTIPDRSDPSANLPLSGVRVLDFTRVLAGPFCTMLLGDMGADVVKVESAEGDDTRQWGPPWFHAGGEPYSAYYLSVNRNKRGITLDLKSEDGQQVARRLAARAHIIVENFKPGGMSAFGLDYATLSALNPALVYASITGYGQTGPYRDRPGYDFVIQGQSGLMSITGAPDGEPYKVGVAVSDVFTGLFAAVSILGALRQAEQGGRGMYLDVSLLDAQIAALVNVASAALVSGETPARYGNAHANIVPYQSFPAADGEFTLAVGNDRQFRQLCALIGNSALADDERYATNPARVANRTALCAYLADIFRTRPVSAWVRDLLALGIPAGEINDVQAILSDEHTAARGLIHTVNMTGVLLRLVGNPIQFDGAPLPIRLPPPTLGEHNEEVLADVSWV